MKHYFRPLVQTGMPPPPDAVVLAGGWGWFRLAERITRGGPRAFVTPGELPGPVLARLCAPRAAICGLGMDSPRLMAILNVTPDSFSDGGRFADAAGAAAEAARIAPLADLIDIGGESTRPGATTLDPAEETARILPVIGAIRRAGIMVPLSVDTRKAAVAQSAIAAGAAMINDVSGLNFDPQMTDIVAENDVPVCIMHARGTPLTMQKDPQYGDVLLDVYDWLETAIGAAEAAGIARARIVADPGIGFGKTLEHNLALLRGVALFHGLGVPILLGTSRKRFIGTLGHAEEPMARMPGSVATALAAIAQGVQLMRVHDIAQTRQALRLWSAVT